MLLSYVLVSLPLHTTTILISAFHPLIMQHRSEPDLLEQAIRALGNCAYCNSFTASEMLRRVISARFIESRISSPLCLSYLILNLISVDNCNALVTPKYRDQYTQPH